MKNTINIFLLLSVATLLFTACTQADPPALGLIHQAANATVYDRGSDQEVHPDEIRYYQTLQELAKGLTVLAADVRYRKSIFGMATHATKEVNGITMKHLSDSLNKTGIDLFADLKATITPESPQHEHASNLLEYAIHGLHYFGRTAYSQVRIPFADMHTAEDLPTLVVDFGNGDEMIFGKKIISDGSARTVSIDKQYAKENLVWIISMND
jgi:hypothetical protein